LVEDILLYVMLGIMAVVIAAMEWLRWYTQAKPNPIVMSIFAAMVVILVAWKVQGAWRKAKRLKLGLEGEKAVGQFLERLREQGAKIFHDIPGQGFNLDHVIVHNTGIYVIETKTLSKPDRGEAKLIYDGQSISKEGLSPNRDPIKQSMAGSSWLSDVIKESTGRAFHVKPVVVYPGWFIQQTGDAKRSTVWVLNPKALQSFISNSRDQLSPEEVNLCAFHLDRYIRAS
jgi:hypothetical protein